MPFPRLLIIGATKSGTSALDAYVRQHPDVHMSPVREPNYFAFPDQPIPYRDHRGRPAVIARTSVTDTDAYRDLFPGVGDGVTGETSPAYLYVPETAANIAARVPDARLVAILRDPVDRAVSAYQHLLREGREPLDLEAAVDAEPRRIEAGWGILWRYVDAGRYATQLQRYLERFDPSQLLVLLHEDLVDDPVATCQRVFAFAGVDPAFVPDVGVRHNVSGVPRRRWLQTLINPPPAVRRRILAVLPGSLAERLRDVHARANEANLDPAPVAAEARAILAERLRPEVLALARLIDRDLGHWLH